MPVTRLLRLLTIFALLFGSISMTGGHAAMAMSGSSAPFLAHAQDAAMAGHCADMDMDKDRKGPSGSNIDCTISCSVIPAIASEMAEPLPLAALSQPLPPLRITHGLNPESDPPPPRHS